MMQRVGAFWVGSSLFLMSGRAFPCSMICAEPSVRTFGDQQEIPGNLVYFKVLTGGDPGKLELRRKDGKRVPASIRTIGRDRVFAPDTPVANGTDLLLSYESRCERSREKPSPATYSFKVGPSATQEFRPPELATIEVGTRYPGTWNEGGFVRVEYYEPDAAATSHHLIDTEVTIDGRPYQFDPGPFSSLPTITVVSECVTRGRTSNGGWGVDSCGRLRSVPPGDHTLTVKPRVVGSKSDPPHASIRVPTTCPRGLLAHPDFPGALSSSLPAPSKTAPVSSATNNVGTKPTRRAEHGSGGGGCDVSRARPRAFGAAWLLAFAVAVRLRSKRA
ncbi:MAG TPA: hypothetical protein VFZ53_34145 [Polyangiaceae bacterium]